MKTPYTIPQVLANLREFDQQLAAHVPLEGRGPGWVRGVVLDILERGIAPEVSEPTADTVPPATSVPLPEAVTLAKLLAADTSPEGMAAVLSGYIRSKQQWMDRQIAAEIAQLRVALQAVIEYPKAYIMSEAELAIRSIARTALAGKGAK